MHPVTSRMAAVKAPADGAATLVRLASAAPPRGLSAHYLGPTGREAMLPGHAADRRLAARVWTWSEELAGL